MGSRKYLVIFHAVTCGQNGPGLGSDEQDIVLIVCLIFDVFNKKIVSVKKYPVRPSSVDINENSLPEEVKAEYQLSYQDIKSAGSLRSVINEVDRNFRDEVPGNFTLITDGQLHLRQTLFPEAYRKNICLPNYYHRFHDLRKEFQSAVGCSIVQENLSVAEMSHILGVPTVCIPDTALREVHTMAGILEKLLGEAGNLHEPELVTVNLLHGIRSKNEQVDTNCVVRARGLPWQASDTDIARFFIGLNVAPGGVALCLSSQGRRNGEALVLFESPAHRDMALRRHKHHIGNRYIEVYKATGDDFIEVAGGNNTEAQEFLGRGGQVIIRMRGLPYDCSPKQVIEFFKNGKDPCKVLDEEFGVLFVKKPDGRATGDAFVLFSEEGDGEKALSKHKELIGSRYIELFRSTTAEVQQVLNRSVDPAVSKSYSPLLPSSSLVHQPTAPLINGLTSVPPLTVIPQQLITAGVRKDCIRLRGLPYEAQVEHILEFLGDHASNIVVQGVHMVFNAQGQPSGEAFIQMDGEMSAHSTANNRHNRYMVIGKKQRYIEVLQCSGEDMSLVLTGGLVSPPTPTKSPLLSPGMFQIPTSMSTFQQLPTADTLQLNPLLYPSNIYLSGLMPPPTNTNQFPVMDFLLPQHSPLFMLPPQQRLLHPSFQYSPQTQFLLPPPQLPAPYRPQFHAPLSLSLPPPSTVHQSGKRTHDEAFHSSSDSVPPKRPPIFYPPMSSAPGGGGLLPIPTITAQTSYPPL